MAHEQPVDVSAVSSFEGRIASKDAGEHVIAAIVQGRHHLLTPAIVNEMKASTLHGVKVGLEPEGLLGGNWSLAGFHFLGATAVNIAAPVLAAPLAAGAVYFAAPAAVGTLSATGAGVMSGSAAWLASAFGVAYDMHSVDEMNGKQLEEPPEDRAFLKYYGFPSKDQLRSKMHIPVVMGFYDLRKGDTVLELAIKAKFLDVKSKKAVLDALMQVYPSEHAGAEALELAVERASKAMGQKRTHHSLAAAMQVLSEVKGFTAREPPKLSWVQLEFRRAAEDHDDLNISQAAKEAAMPLLARMAEASQLRLMMIDLGTLPADVAFHNLVPGQKRAGDKNGIGFSTYFLEATVKDEAGDGAATKQLYFTFGDGSVFTESQVVATISTEEPHGYASSYEVEVYPKSGSMVERMEKVCGMTNFSLILRNSEHMMRYIVGGVWHSVQTLNTTRLYKEVIVKEFAPALKAGAALGSKRSVVQDVIRTHLNVAPFELEKRSTATGRPVFCKKGCPACEIEAEGENSDGEFEVEVEGHMPEPGLFKPEGKLSGAKPLSSLTRDMMENDVNIVLVGPTGCGKSHLLNVLFNCDLSASTSSTRSVTADIHFFRGKLNFEHPLVVRYVSSGLGLLFHNKTVNIIDTVGFCDTKRDPREVMDLIKSRLEHNLVKLHKIVVVNSAGQRTQKDHITPIKTMMEWLNYKDYKRNFVFVYNKCDGLTRDERQRNQVEVLEDLGASQQATEGYICDPDTGKKVLVSSTIAVGFPPKERHLRKQTEKSLQELALALLYWDASTSPVPVPTDQSLAKCIKVLARN